jgi:hypothetical protein
MSSFKILSIFLRFLDLKGYLQYKFRLRKVKTLSLFKQISPKNTDGIFGVYIGVQEPEKIPKMPSDVF